ncbi:hypothetical protein EXU85_28950 [Spirosoma sp. KCTC 42546]|uniref:hypothetical protein n=1 Tax=Spirosoma sp. KCTC 42546 TaxID=2520506 RepID=UPI001158B20A|nr:hypothetical protein [Spirosoma sp. KCTC 42546]QDK82419.1 hypothetical protein EXU85_28950 [Spirosoma sp. KCTC 42546]
MKKLIIAASVCSLLSIAQLGFAQAVQEGKAAKKEMKAEKKVAKAIEYKHEASTHKGLEVKGISDPKTRMAKADRKMEKAEKKEMKGEAKELKAVAKAKTKKAAGVD